MGRRLCCERLAVRLGEWNRAAGRWLRRERLAVRLPVIISNNQCNVYRKKQPVKKRLVPVIRCMRGLAVLRGFADLAGSALSCTHLPPFQEAKMGV